MYGDISNVHSRRYTANAQGVLLTSKWTFSFGGFGGFLGGFFGVFLLKSKTLFSQNEPNQQTKRQRNETKDAAVVGSFVRVLLSLIFDFPTSAL